MEFAVVLVLAVALLAGLIQAEKTNSPKKILTFKTPLSLLFIVAWTLQPSQNPFFSGLILAALVFCLGGDVLLGMGSDKAFLGGLVSFLLGHVMYTAAFFTAARVGTIMAVAMIVLLFAAALVWRWLGPHLEEMKVPVLAYMVVISIMVCAAAGLAANAALPGTARAVILLGAVLFYISDLFVARQRFLVDAIVNRQIGLPLYYSAQFLLAFSAGWVP
ncbi:hypothetical protein DSCW_10910 [Desulfosarcina widdelii]|uniref:Lysoplasmalogenase n=1 Tax=Desulfosarcina widdelii TaxID=947919 RepID=A0A5K7Z5D8_9BACT|nr:lysoplasmalogenase [Desulfosarcina widdelii]BBO73674.1 hypothetical protein DSCW_10910 [Desulfosarcina widdelii]